MIQVRLAESSDALGLKTLNDLFNGKDSNCAESIGTSLTENKQEIVCVAVDGENMVVGFCCGQIVKSMCYSILYGDITEFYIIDEYRQSDVGKQLIEFIECEFGRCGVAHLHHLTGKDNLTTQELFSSLGFADSTKSSYNSSSLKIYEKQN